MPRLPRITGSDALRALKKAGWGEARRKGSHVLLRHPELPGRITIPIHAGVTLKPKTLLSIIDQAGMTAEEFRRLL